MARNLVVASGLVVSVLTLPLGLLAGMFLGFQTAAVVFILGWFLLTPLLVVGGDEALPALEARRDDEAGDETADPLSELKERYARGEIGDEEFERRVERLVEVDDLDPGEGTDRGRNGRGLAAERE